jgi:hypothetical protein
VVEDVDFLDTRKALSEHVFDFFIVAAPHSRIVCEGFLLCWSIVDCKSGVVGVEAVGIFTNVVYASLVVLHLEGHAGPVDFAPWLLRYARGQVDVLEARSRHICGL